MRQHDFSKIFARSDEIPELDVDPDPIASDPTKAKGLGCRCRSLRDVMRGKYIGWVVVATQRFFLMFNPTTWGKMNPF